MKFISTVVFVSDMDASREFYANLLGQKIEMDIGPYVTFEYGFALWLSNHASEIIYGSPSGIPDKPGHKNFELYFESEEIERALENMKDANVEILHEIHEAPWGQRSIRVLDPDGYIVEIGEPMSIVIERFLSDGLSVDEVAKRTSMPVEIVRNIMEKAAKE